MRVAEKKIVLKEGTECLLRSPEEEDAPAALKFFLTVTEESPYLLAETKECTVEKERTILRRQIEDENGAMIAAFLRGDGEIAGLVSVRRVSASEKLRHRAELGISVVGKWQGKGLGSALLFAAEEWAKKEALKQLELSVFSENRRALSLYEKFGYEIWGARKNAFRFPDGRYNDEVIMGKFL